MFSTTLDILYFVLAVGFGTLLLSLTVLILRVVKTVDNVNRITEIAEDSADTINGYIKIPEHLADQVMGWVKSQDFLSSILSGKKKD